MLRELRLRRFKCFDDLTLPLRPLTLLTGTNGGGKSSVIQSLVLLSHTVATREWAHDLLLDGPEIALGTAADVQNQHAADRSLTLGVSTADHNVDWQFDTRDRRALSLPVSGLVIDGQSVSSEGPLRWLIPAVFPAQPDAIHALRGLSWITAERTGPRELLPLRDPATHRKVGARGELAAGLLHWNEDATVSPTLRLPGAPPTLFHQVRARMQEFFPGCDLRISPIDGASAISLRLRTDPRSEFLRPQNVGFGLTQLFPILVAVLAAQPGDCLLIENPEVHLHPRAQQHIGWLLALAAASGVQLIIETHSDHVLNGLRLATKQGRIKPEHVAVHFFAPDPNGAPVRPKSPTLDADGRMSDWPDGFFDQFDLALSELL